MAALSESDRAAVWAEYMRSGEGATGCLKAQLRAVFDAVDDYLEANAAAMNLAIPQPMRGLLTTKEKAAIYARVIERRYKVT